MCVILRQENTDWTYALPNGKILTTINPRVLIKCVSNYSATTQKDLRLTQGYSYVDNMCKRYGISDPSTIARIIDYFDPCPFLLCIA